MKKRYFVISENASYDIDSKAEMREVAVFGSLSQAYNYWKDDVANRIIVKEIDVQVVEKPM